ncbi:probable disease resistance protein At4g27220 [Durio zibethinus]|uniref:Probable disease resistance protein At4g27220 n=1 Tax=Durio zibethinus TaxID=66656 RepID=A0A6P5XKZ9_DURZI|nr:probable disease resistance protein At4g27220 [Durio zibethinus]
MACGFCESALSNCMGTLLVDWVVKPVGHQLNYIRRFHDNAEKLKEKKEELKMARVRLQHEIEDAKRRLPGIEDDVTTMLSKADKILSDMETLENEMQQNKRCFNLCPNWSWQYQLSKKETKNTPVSCELLKEIRQFCQPGRVGYRSTSTITTIEFLSSKDFMVSKSSNIALDHIIQALKDDRVSMIGLWGMAGVGKTSLVREVGTYAKKKNLFDKVVITTVSKKPNFKEIQDEIAKDLDFYMKNEQGRISRQEFWSKLKEVKRILIILDDVWANIDLKEEIGIPIGEDHKGCKILLTTRRQQVCDVMECQRRIQLGFLDDQEAWGKNLHRWEAAYRRLENRRLVDIEDIDEKNAYLVLERAGEICMGTRVV